MQFYERVLARVNGALAAHFGKTLPYENKQQMLGFVYSMKYEYQQRFDEMEVVGRELDGKVEAVLTPTGFVKRIRVNPQVSTMNKRQQHTLVLSAVSKARRKGKALMQEAEQQVYGLFLRDLKPWVYGIRDNPEFFTIPEDAVETPQGIIAPDWLTPQHIHRTIPFESWKSRDSVHQTLAEKEATWLKTAEGQKWASTIEGQRYVQSLPENRPQGAPGRLMAESHKNKNVAYTTGRKDMLEEYQKNKTLMDMWFSHPTTASPSARDYDRQLARIIDDELTLRAAKVDWQATRADDRAFARRQAQDEGLEPHYQNFAGMDLKKHWHIKRRELGTLDLYDYDTVRPKRRMPSRPVQQSMKITAGMSWNAKHLHDKDEFSRWTVARDISRQPIDQKGALSQCYTIKDAWHSKLSAFPEAKANIA